MTKFRIHFRIAAVALAFCVAAAVGSAQTLTTLFSFDGFNGEEGVGALVQGLDGNFYGISGGGVNNSGTVFRITSSGTLTTLYSFCAQTNCTDGLGPAPELVLSTDGNFYGATEAGGVNGSGTVFKMTPDGTLTTLYSFCSKVNCRDGGTPSGLVQATDGNFYGTTTGGGAGKNCVVGPCGTVFKMTPSGKLSTLYRFCTQPNCTDGAGPIAPLIQGTNDSLYGATMNGGLDNGGTVFSIGPGGILTTLHSFTGLDGADPHAGLVQASGSLYGTTFGGGTAGHCLSCGTVYRITGKGQFGAISFNRANGAFPFAGLIQATDGNLYGTTSLGGSGSQCGDQLDCGTIFKLTPLGKLTTLYSFCAQVGCPDGTQPNGALVQGTDGNFYGLTFAGGASDLGTVFVLSVGLGPFVRTLPASGTVGAEVFILGTNLTGASSVTFNGASAAFTVVSGSEITTTVPAGATSGTVQVITPSGTLNSNVAFQVQ